MTEKKKTTKMPRKALCKEKFFAMTDWLFKNKIFMAALMMIWVAFTTIAVQYAVAFVALKMFDRETLTSTVGTTIMNAISWAISLLLILYIPKKLKKQWKSDREALGLMGLPTWTDIGLAPIGFVVMWILTSVVTALFSFFPWFDAGQAQNVGYDYTGYLASSDKLVAFITLVVIAPIIEEIIFRGWLYGKLRARFAMPISILLTSVLFGIVHLQWNVGVNVFATSIILCLLREITGTIYSGMILHMLKNGVAFFLLFVLGYGV